VKLAPAETDDDKGKSLDEAIADYLEDVHLTKKRKTVLAYATALEYFPESTSEYYLSEIDCKDLPRFSAFLRDEKDSLPAPYETSFQT
jgi:hypothetical protein